MGDPATISDIPRFSQKLWNEKAFKNQAGTIELWGANCLQYGFSGSDASGNNVIYYEKSPNPGELSGHVSNQWQNRGGFIELMEKDGFPILQQSALPPAKKGYYLVGAYHDGTHDYHFVRQDADGGWSDKRGQNALVTRYLEPNPDGSHKTPPERFGDTNYQLVGYVYVPKQGVNLGVEHQISTVLTADTSGKDLETFLKGAAGLGEAGCQVLYEVGKTLEKYYPKLMDEYQAAEQKYAPSCGSKPKGISPIFPN